MKYLIIILLIFAATTVQTTAQQPDGRINHAAVIVQYASGQVAARCVGFDEDAISGYDLLQRAGFGVIAEQNSVGALVCSIDGVGCDYPNQSCLCQCEGSQCTYWAYSHLLDGVWKYSVQGAKQYQVRDGAVEGWAWGGGSIQTGSTPPVIGWGEVCAAQAAPLPTQIPPTTIPTLLPPTVVPATSLPTNTTRVPVAIQTVAPTQIKPSQMPKPSATNTSIPTSTTQASPSLTATPSATGTSQTSATSVPSPMSKPAGIIATPNPPKSSPIASNWRNYAIFVGIVVLLGGAMLVLRKRKI